MIKRSQQVLLEALRASLHGSTFTYPDDTDWAAVTEEAKAQTVMGFISPVIPVHDESTDQGKAYYMRLLHEQDKLVKLFDAHDIPFVILKGFAAAVYYPKPYLRTMGDVDILVPRGRFEEAMKVMEADGYTCRYGKKEDGQPVQGVRHIEYVKNGIEYELHHHFSTDGFDIDDILESAINRREYRELSGHRFPVLPDTENGLVLLGHIHQHINLDSLGLRQIIDWEMYYHSVMKDKEREKEFASLARKAGLSRLADNVTGMCVRHLGLTVTSGTIKQNDIADELLESLLTSGNFGIKKSGGTGDDISSVVGIMERKGLFSYFQDNGLETWKMCRKHPALKPFAFIYGFLRFCVRGTAGVVKDGSLREQISYVRRKKSFERELGIRTSGSGDQEKDKEHR